MPILPILAAGLAAWKAIDLARAAIRVADRAKSIVENIEAAAEAAAASAAKNKEEQKK